MLGVSAIASVALSKSSPKGPLVLRSANSLADQRLMQCIASSLQEEGIGGGARCHAVVFAGISPFGSATFTISASRLSFLLNSSMNSPGFGRFEASLQINTG
jgi:hypothetical protein